MSRRRQAVKRPLIPDPRYNSTLVTNLVNMIMERGKRTVAQRIVYTAFQRVSEKLEKGDPVDLVMGALENARPKLEVKSRRVGGATYQVPVEISFERQQSLAFRWMVSAARNRKGVPMDEALADSQTRARGMVVELDGVKGVRSPFVFSDAELALDRPSPKLGGD